jgi:hypothetical protein
MIFFLILVSLSNSSFSQFFCSLSISFPNCYFQLARLYSFFIFLWVFSFFLISFCSLCLSFFTGHIASTKTHCTIRSPRFGACLIFVFCFYSSFITSNIYLFLFLMPELLVWFVVSAVVPHWENIKRE